MLKGSGFLCVFASLREAGPGDPPEPEELATDAISDLEAAVQELNQMLALQENGNGGKA